MARRKEGLGTTPAAACNDLITGVQGAASVADVLKRARYLIEKPGSWTRHVMARDELGEWAPWDADDATCFCSLGAILRAGIGTAMTSRAIDAIRAVIPTRLISQFNDDEARDQAEVLSVFDRAIAAAEGGTVIAPTPAAAGASPEPNRSPS